MICGYSLSNTHLNDTVPVPAFSMQCGSALGNIVLPLCMDGTTVAMSPWALFCSTIAQAQAVLEQSVPLKATQKYLAAVSLRRCHSKCAVLTAGKDVSFDQYKGKVVLVTNVACYCGLTNGNYKV